jgi:hypothetical protein
MAVWNSRVVKEDWTGSEPLILPLSTVPKDPSAHWEMIEGLASRYKAKTCSFNTIFGSFQGHGIYASRKVAEKIEKQTRYAAELYNVDARQDQRCMAEHDIPPWRQR